MLCTKKIKKKTGVMHDQLNLLFHLFLFFQLIVCIVTKFPLLESTPIPLLFKEETSSVTETHLTS